MTICLNKIRSVICDIDGTLTHDRSVHPSAYTIDVLERLHKKGFGFSLASGRSLDQLLELKDEWGLSFDFELVIGLNGSEYYDGKNRKAKTLYILQREDIKEIITKMLNEFPDLNCSIYSDGMRMLRYEDKEAIESKKRTGINNYMVKDLSEMWDRPCSKVMFRVDEETMKKIEPLAIRISNDRFRCCKTQTTMMEFVHAESNKGNALKDYCSSNDIDIESFMAFGDMSNDLELIEAAGIGVSMINGSSDCKAVADYITKKDNNEDGCADFIDRYLFG
ncbi:MAG: HAD family phosphatase [Erysipelotrichaceae bacterium]|nr:HAD family phosphatase [Erysipelotrichaceae bacterium]